MTTLGTRGTIAAALALIALIALSVQTIMAQAQDNARPANLQAAELSTGVQLTRDAPTEDSRSTMGSSYTLANSSEKPC